MANLVDEDFVEYCRQCTNEQLENVLKHEYDAFQQRDYASACIAAAERGWITSYGKRLC
jgi:hypothetical protein